jgi:hypothetical protein
MRALSTLLALALPLAADIGPRPSSSASGPRIPSGDLPGVEVSMESEEVELTLGRADRDRWVDRLDVRATFRMKNHGGATAFEIGFPVGRVMNMRDFRATAGGAPAASRLVDLAGGTARPVDERTIDPEDDRPHDFWWVWDATWPERATVDVAVSYRLELFAFSEHRRAGYVLATGAGWKGPIGKAVVSFRCAAPLSLDHVASARPLGAGARSNDAIVWNFERLEPAAEHDVEVAYNAMRPWEERLAALREEARVHWNARREAASVLARAHERFARTRPDAAEREALLAALGAMFEDATADGDGWTLPAEEPRRLQIGDDVDPETRAEILRDRGTEVRAYARPESAGQLFEFFPLLLDTAAADPKSPVARAALARWAEFGESFLAGKVRAGGRALELAEGAREAGRAELRAQVERARELLK